jgi:anti-anti-sigma factor
MDVTVVVDEPDLAVVIVRGDVDIVTAPTLRAALATLDERDTDVAIDVAGVTFMDSTGLAILAAETRRERERGKRLHVRNPPASVLRLLRIAGLADLIEIDLT